MTAGKDGKETVFLFTDTQIQTESFLEDINNILNSGDVPNLYGNDDIEQINAAMRPLMTAAKLPITKMGMFAYYINRVQANLHVVLCFSPIGDMFRNRLRMFPSLVNCCTIDWFAEWPDEALQSVANYFLNDVDTTIGEQDVKAGNEFMRGLSGGNKRRLSIAVALAKRPSVLFLDEPTSGVDSASAVMIMSFLRKIAQARSITIACTIHQPPASVFAGFDNCMVLSMGRVAYFGKAESMGEYFASVGNAPPPDTNIAEFVLDLVNTDFTPEAGVRTLLDRWAERGGKPYHGASGEPAPAPQLAQADVLARAGFCSQLGVLVWRDLLVAKREPLAYLLRGGVNSFCCLFFGIIYLETRNRKQDQVQSRTFFIMFALGVPMQLVLVAVYQYYQQWVSLKKEVKDGMYHQVAAAVASWVVQVPMQFVLAACSMVHIFLLGDMHWPNFPMAWIIYAVTFWAFEGMAQARGGIAMGKLASTRAPPHRPDSWP